MALVDRTCKLCGAAFQVAPWRARQGEGLFCSKRCAGTFNRRTDPLLDTAGRFWAKADRSGGPDACWNWQAGCYPAGYGIFSVTRRERKAAHRFAYELTYGPVPDGAMVLHSCDNKLCVNPAHLRAGSATDNVRDAVERDRHARGERNGGARLTEAQALEVLQLARSGVPTGEVAERFGISAIHVRSIARGLRWKHLHARESTAEELVDQVRL